MARDKITEYDSTAANNTVCGDVNIAENSALPSDMNNFAREIMTHLKEGLGSGTPVYLDQTNNRVGINVASPTAALDVNGTVTADAATIDNGVLTVNNTGTRKVEISGNGYSSFTGNPILDGGIEFTNQFGHVFSAGVSNSDGFEIFDGATKIVRLQGGGDISFYDSTGVTQGLRWDASTQRLGLGTTSPSVGGGSYGMHIKGPAGKNAEINLDSSDANTSGWLQFSENGTNQWRIAYDPTANHLEFTESGVADRMVIQDGGNVGIGTASPSTLMHLRSASPVIQLEDTDAGGSYARIDCGSATGNIYFSADHNNSSGNGKLIFATSGSEAARIDSSGSLLVGKTSTTSYASGSMFRSSGKATLSRDNDTLTVFTDINTANTGSGKGAILFKRGTTETLVGYISTTTSSTSYVTSSDYRLKENITDADDAGSKIDAIQVRQFDWIADGSHQDYGMVAQELQTVAPEAVSGNPDSDEMMGVDYSKLVPMLVKEIQQLRSRVAALEAN